MAAYPPYNAYGMPYGGFQQPMIDGYNQMQGRAPAQYSQQSQMATPQMGQQIMPTQMPVGSFQQPVAIPQPAVQALSPVSRAVGGKEEALAAQIAFDGSTALFLDASHKKIYAKSFSFTEGRCIFDTYSKDEEVPEQQNQSQAPINVVGFASEQDFNGLSDEVEQLKSQIQQLKSQIQYLKNSSLTTASVDNVDNSESSVENFVEKRSPRKAVRKNDADDE